MTANAGGKSLSILASPMTVGALTIRRVVPQVLLADEADTATTELVWASVSAPKIAIETTPLGRADTIERTFVSTLGHTLRTIVGRLARSGGVFFRASFHNATDEPIRLRRTNFLARGSDAVTLTGSPVDWVLSDMDVAHGGASLAESLPSANELTRSMWEDGFKLPVPFKLPADEKATDGRWRCFQDFTVLSSDKGRNVVIGGAVTTEADLSWDWFVDGERLELEILSKMSDVRVDGGASRTSETALILAGDYDTVTAELFTYVAATHGHRTHRSVPVGWCSWYDRGPGITADHIIRSAEAMASLHDRIPVDVIQIDDGFQRQVGDWRCNDTFVDGLAPIVKAIDRAGATPGLWLAPLAVHEQVGGANYTCQDGKVVDLHKDWFQRDAQGEFVGEANNWGPRSRWLDPTHPQAASFIRQLIAEVVRQGFNYLKIDFNELGYGVRWHDPCKTRLQAYRDLYRLYRETLGESGYLLACSGFKRGVIGYADAARIGPDSCPQWQALHPCCISPCVRAVGSNAPANGVLLTNDPDVTYLKPRGELTEAELHTWHGVVGLLGGLTAISEPLAEQACQTDNALRMMEILTPPAREKGRSLHGAADPHHARFGFVSRRPWGVSATVQIYNPAAAPADMPLDVPALTELGESFFAWSFWNSEFLGEIDNAFVIKNLQSHASKLLRLTALSDAPVCVGSDLHISAGAAELADWQVTARSLRIVLSDAGARSGFLYIHSRSPLTLTDSTGIDAVAATSPQNNLWKVHIIGRKRAAEQTISLSIGA